MPERNQSASLRRALAVLEHVREHSGLSLTQLAEAVGLPKSTVLRLAAPLVEARLLDRDRRTGAYRLGHGTLRLGQSYLATLDLRAVAAEESHRLMTEVRDTRHTIVDPERLRADLAHTRRRGYAVDDRENEPEVRCVAAPIFNHHDAVAAAISVSGLTSRITAARVHELGPLVAGTAVRISRKLGSQCQ